MPLASGEQENGLPIEVVEIEEKGASCGGNCGCH
jgi:hypothetical protein